MFQKKIELTSTFQENLLKKREKTLSSISALSFPALPPTVRSVLVLCGSLSSDAPEISKAICYDFGMTLHLLRTINSAFYSADKAPVISVLHAVVLLGMDVLTQTVLEMPRAKIDEFRVGGNRTPPLWVTLSGKKVFASHLALSLSRHTDLDPDHVFYLALFRDLGETIVSFVFEERYGVFVRSLQKKRRNKDVASREAFGLTFDELTKHLMVKWNLPKVLAEVLYLKKDRDKVARLRRRTPQLLAHLANELVDSTSIPGLKGLRIQEDSRKKLKDLCGVSEKMINSVVRKEIKGLERNSPIYYESLKAVHFFDNLLI